ncbi:preprotein translocase subunit SecE [Thermosediminibacter oceani]|uniref:Protein translocase subunit SecE n=1 Tax=Thermosediminibacter oceani (strain ATCC BAA-1034 / DSM 16646 / JW/IW-1228P) TaxID=555079 RepID=D9S0G1_THEOJ|nr:preprotein translocase subunit SecE [Thermosediminibacter oceani]ADL08819.1 preprotein translocase, SecE subunit [Thermosediminibacter oceani DSM 16646]
MAAGGEGFLKRSSRFFKEVRSELKKVTWPTRDELVSYTIVVLVSVALVSGFIWIVDSILMNVLKTILR